MLDLVQTSILVGLLYCFFTIGLSVSFRVINYPDLTLEGSAILGGALCFRALCLGINPIVALSIGFVSGALAGVFTGALYIYANVSKLLSGIITTAILYSLNIRLLGGKSNARLLSNNTVFSQLEFTNRTLYASLTIVFIVGFLLVLLFIFFHLRIGYLIRVLGDNENYLNSLGKNPKVITLIGLGLANGIIGLGGAILVQYKNTCDINMSSGLLVGALAAMMLGESLATANSIFKYFILSIIGTIAYSLVIGAVLFNWNSNWERYVLSSDVRLFTGLLLILLAIIIKLRKGKKISLFNSHW